MSQQARTESTNQPKTADKQKSTANQKSPDEPVEARLTETVAAIAERSHELVREFLKAHQQYLASARRHGYDPLGIGSTFLTLTRSMMVNPFNLAAAQWSLYGDYLNLWQRTLYRFGGGKTEAIVKPAPGDRRFQHPHWEENPVFDFIKQTYLLTATWLQETVTNAIIQDHRIDRKTAKKIHFYLRQYVDAISPSNFLLTNPEVLNETVRTGGQNLRRGLNNLLTDLKRSGGRLDISMSDPKAFQIGGNLATTPGKVIYQTELMQLIQYEPTTEEVYKRPLLMIPAWINKYYILDLQPRNSMVRWLVEQGYTVFVISWVNPDETLSHKKFDDYMTGGVLAALDAIEQATGEREVTALGYCIGGTLLASTLAYLAAKNDHRIKAATMLASQVDFSEMGEMEVFIDDQQLSYIEKLMEEKGYLEGAQMSSAFKLLRANDLIWSFMVENYLMGRKPYPFDLLHWNSDATRMPRDMQRYYLREFVHGNKLVEPGAIVLDGVAIDLREITCPIYLQAAKEDHIAPYYSVFKAVHHYRGPVRFVLAGSGHIAGAINPPAANKYLYWTNPGKTKDLEQWLSGAKENPGSWWTDWHQWLSKKSGRKVPARIPGGGVLKPIEDAPGSYVTA